MKIVKQLYKRLLLQAAAPLLDVLREDMRRTVVEQTRSIDFGLRLRAILESADFVAANIPLHRRFTHVELRQKSLELAPKEGLIMEFGVWQGMWINLISSWTTRKVYGFDSFEGLPEPWSLNQQGHFALNSLPQVRDNVVLVKGWFNESLPPFLAEHPGEVAFIHMDCDLYSSTRTVLDLLRPRLRAGTVIVFDDFMCEPGWQREEHKAFFDFVKEHGILFEYIGYAYSVPSCSAAIQITRV